MNLITNREITMHSQLKNCIENFDKIYINVSFVRDSGMKILIQDLIQASEQGKK